MLKLNNDKKKTSGIIVMIITLMISITGATYAYFSIVPPINNAVKGEAAQANLLLNIDRTFPNDELWNSSSKVMTTYNGNLIGEIMGEPSYCIDNRENVACQVYEIIITNDSTAGVVLDGKIVFSGTNEMPNLKWRLLASDSVVNNDDLISRLPNQSVRSVVDEEELFLEEDISMEPNAKRYYYLLMWINKVVDENGNSVFQSDNGTYTATVTFEAANGLGVTSTFTQ